VTASYQGWRAGRRVAGLLAARRPVLGGATPTGKSRGCGVAGAGVYNPRLDSTRLAPFSSIRQVAVLNPLSSEYPLLLKLGEGGALHFYTRVAAYVRDTYYVSVGESTSWRRRTGGHPCAQFLALNLHSVLSPLRHVEGPPPCTTSSSLASAHFAAASRAQAAGVYISPFVLQEKYLLSVEAIYL